MTTYYDGTASIEECRKVLEIIDAKLEWANGEYAEELREDRARWAKLLAAKVEEAR